MSHRPPLLAISLKDNILFGCSAKDEEVREVLKLADAKELIADIGTHEEPFKEKQSL